MELILVALIGAAATIVVAVITRESKRAHARNVAWKEELATNGSKLPLGALLELVADDVRDTKNAVRRVERKVDKHHSLPAGAAHPEEA
jgi:hypothetical protein